MKSVYRGNYRGTGTGTGTMVLSVEAQNGTELKAAVNFEAPTSHPLKGTISRDEQIILKYVGSDPNVILEFKGSLLPNGSIKGTFVSGGRDFTWEVS